MPILQTVFKHLTWYAFLALFGLTALLLAVSSGTGVIFSLVLAALISLMQLGWLALAELRTLREYQIAQLEVSTQLLEVQLLREEVPLCAYRSRYSTAGVPSVQTSVTLEHAHD
jgi:hypothetical protein